MSDNRASIERLHELRAESRLGGGQARIDKQHQKGKLTARERLELLLDPGSFVEFDAFVTHRSRDFGLEKQKILGDGVVTGHGKIDGRLVFVFSQDFTVFGGSLSETPTQRRSCKLMDTSHAKLGVPIVGLNDSRRRAHSGRRGRIPGWLRRHLPAQHLGVGGHPADLSAGDGALALGGAVYSPAITDFVADGGWHVLHVRHRAPTS